MSRLQKIKKIIPFVILFALLAILGRELFYSNPNELPSALIGEEVPDFNLPNLFGSQPAFTPKAFAGRVSLLNVWATWCYACEIEHPMLMKISNQYHVPIYGIVYKDQAKDAIAWLVKNGNPFVMSGDDRKGNVAIDLGVYGTPETFVINAQGKIVYRHIGAIDQKTWDDVLYPLIKKYGG
jgi:cytochrome c biogenesis protein CcmG, thiol:disulfide interchange protein DsbE